LAMVCSPSRARFTSRPAAFNSSTRSSTKRRASDVFRTAAARRAGTCARQIRSTPRPTGQRGQLLAQKNRVPRRQFNGLGQQQLLRRRGAVCSSRFQHLLEQYPFVRGVLVEQDKSAVGFQHGIKFADDADEPERDVEERSRRLRIINCGLRNWLRRGWRMESAFALLRRDGDGSWNSRFDGCRFCREKPIFKGVCAAGEICGGVAGNGFNFPEIRQPGAEISLPVEAPLGR